MSTITIGWGHTSKPIYNLNPSLKTVYKLSLVFSLPGFLSVSLSVSLSVAQKQKIGLQLVAVTLCFNMFPRTIPYVSYEPWPMKHRSNRQLAEQFHLLIRCRNHKITIGYRICEIIISYKAKILYRKNSDCIFYRYILSGG